MPGRDEYIGSVAEIYMADKDGYIGSGAECVKCPETGELRSNMTKFKWQILRQGFHQSLESGYFLPSTGAAGT